MEQQTANEKQTNIAVKKEQEAVLKSLLQNASDTKFGTQYRFHSIEGWKSFSHVVPVQTYSDIEPTVEQLKNGATGIYWPGEVTEFAVSSGTSGKGKHIPVTDARLAADRRFMRKIALAYFRQRPNPLRILGKHLSIPGSAEKFERNLIGEVSSLSAIHAPSWLRWFQLESPEKLTQLSFQDKFNLLLQKSVGANIKVITASPSWILTLFQNVLNQTGKQQIREVWPKLNLLICGGLKLANYKTQLQKLIGDSNTDFIETYGASEGYIGFSDVLSNDHLKMVIDNGVFFECIPHPLPNEKASGIQKTIPLWEAKRNIPYGLMVSTNAGLWRYPLNDIIEFTNTDNLRFTVKGRVNDMLDDYGEALYIYEAEETLKKTAEKFNLEIGNFTIASTLKSEQDIPFHHWFIQFVQPVHTDTLHRISDYIDQELQNVNRHYAIRRETEALGAPKINSVTQADVNRWLKAQGRRKAQAKLPKILTEGIEVFE